MVLYILGMPAHIRNTLILATLVVVVAGLFLYLQLSGASAAANEAAVRSTATSFGLQLKGVSLLSPDASTTMARAYGPYVTSQLLEQWQKNPSKAPGHLTSSPWPDRVDIDNVAPQGNGYIVTGNIIMMTSKEVTNGGNAGTVPVVLQLVRENNTWLIAVYQEQSAQQPTQAATSS